MKKIILMSLFSLCTAGAACAGDSRWITFRKDRNSQGAIEFQIDRSTIRQEAFYKTFWTRVWVVKDSQPLAFTNNERLVFLSEKFVADCAHRRFGSRFIDSNQPAEIRHKTSIAAMRWENLDMGTAADRAVCGDK